MDDKMTHTYTHDLSNTFKRSKLRRKSWGRVAVLSIKASRYVSSLDDIL